MDDLEDIAGQYGININWSNLKASKQDPHQTELQIYTPKGKTTKAMEYFDKSIDRYGHIEGLVEKGILLIEMSKYDFAIKSFETF